MLKTPKIVLLLAWITALAATAGSLTLSEAFHFVPCTLCWYQRILMFPLVAVLGVGYLKQDQNVVAYSLPLAATGTLLAAYHSLLQWGIIHEPLTPCLATVSCTVKQINLLGFITIPFLSLLAFSAITTCLLTYRRFELRG